MFVATSTAGLTMHKYAATILALCLAALTACDDDGQLHLVDASAAGSEVDAGSSFDEAPPASAEELAAEDRRLQELMAIRVTDVRDDDSCGDECTGTDVCFQTE